MSADEKIVLKLNIDEAAFEEYSDAQEASVQTVEFEVPPPVDISDPRKLEIYKGISDVDERLGVISARIDKLNSEIDTLTNHADGIDYAIAVASGIIAGIIDSVWVGEFSIDRANEWGKDKVDNFVVKIAQSQGYEGDGLKGAIKRLEDNFPIAADKATNDFGGGLQHHLRDFSHHPTPIGLFFSNTIYRECIRYRCIRHIQNEYVNKSL